MSLYSCIAALCVILATARAQSESELPLSAAQCDCGTIQSKLDQQDQRVAEKLDRNQNSTASIFEGLLTKLNHLEHRISKILAEQENKTEAVLNDHVKKLDQLLEDRVSQMLERQQNGTEAILKDLKQVIESDEDKILAQQNLTQQSAVNVSKIQQNQYVDTQFGPNWIVILERIDDSGNFARPWKDYRDGFGTVGHFWLGLEKMHQLTKDSPYELAVEMTEYETGEKLYARYDSFEIGSEEQEYPLVKLETHSASAGDYLQYHKSASFSTYDSGKDIAFSKSYGNGGWWFGPDYVYLTGARGVSLYTGMQWWLSGTYKQLSSARMMIRAI